MPSRALHLKPFFPFLHQNSMEALIETFGIDWRLLGLQTLNFVVLALALTWLLYKPVMKAVSERERVLRKGVEDAEEAAQKLSEADEEASKRVGKADQEAEAIVKSARTQANAEKSALMKEAEGRAVQIEKDAEARAAEEAARGKRESEKEIARVALLAAEKIMHSSSAKATKDAGTS
jgi:F-type H+-transporting ATPase subunit b